ncbi:MAG: hypothetical protein J4F43_08130 [Dehalococcoidia bacterium]|nr:hypothetical protein [Dehalococcoidia bacterium]
MSKTYLPYDPDQQLLLPAALQEWLPPDHLPCFAMRRAFPGSDYYEGSVAIGGSPRRQSRVPLTLGIGSAYTFPMMLTALPGDLVFALIVGGVIGLMRWWRLPETGRGHPAGSMLRWMGIVFGLLVLRVFVDAVLSLAWIQLGH